jgi:hypothetical protein
MPAAVVTVALTPVEILKVTLAKEYGPMTLVLRKFNDNQIIDSQSVKMTLENIVSGKGHGDTQEKSDVPEVVKKDPPKVDPPKVDPVPPVVVAKTHTHIVTILNAERQEQWEFTLDENEEVVGQRLLGRDTPRSTEAVQPPAAPSLTNPPPPAATPPAATPPAGGQPANPAG